MIIMKQPQFMHVLFHYVADGNADSPAQVSGLIVTGYHTLS